MLASELMSKVYTLHRATDALAVNELRRTLENADLTTLEAARKLAIGELSWHRPYRGESNYHKVAKLIHAEIVKRRGY